MTHHHSSVGGAIIQIVIGLILAPPAFLIFWRVRRQLRSGTNRPGLMMSANGGWPWGLPLFVGIVGIGLVIKGILAL